MFDRQKKATSDGSTNDLPSPRQPKDNGARLYYAVRDDDTFGHPRDVKGLCM